MIEITIPGKGTIKIEHLVCDVNGTLAVDGQLLPGIAEAIASIQGKVQVHLLTADTHGKQYLIDEQLNLKADRVAPGDEANQKAAYIQKLGAKSTAAIGQGANDSAMLKTAILGIAVLSPEGTAVATLLASDIVTPNTLAAFELLLKPVRITATLRK